MHSLTLMDEFAMKIFEKIKGGDFLESVGGGFSLF